MNSFPYPKNARTHSDAQIAQIAASILEFGFVNAVLIGPDNQIIAGHARVAAARMVGLTEVPVIVLDHLSPSQRRALVIADNRLALGASWDEELLGLELAALREEEVDLKILGFAQDQNGRIGRGHHFNLPEHPLRGWGCLVNRGTLVPWCTANELCRPATRRGTPSCSDRCAQGLRLALEKHIAEHGC